MGVDAGDFDNDGDDDLFMTQLPTEGNNLYVNDGSGLFEDRSARSGARTTQPRLHRLRHRLVRLRQRRLARSVRGERRDRGGRRTARPTTQFPYDERKLLFRNLRQRAVRRRQRAGRRGLPASEVGRGAAFGDIDNDGDIDVVVSNMHRPARLLINNVGNRQSLARACGWSAARDTARDMLGARVEIVRRDGAGAAGAARAADGSYASANDPRVLVGLGESTEAPTVRVTLAGRPAEEHSEVAIDRWIVCKQGKGHVR